MPGNSGCVLYLKNIWKSNYDKRLRQINTRRLLNISRKEQLSFQMILSRYIQERFLYRVSVSEYASKFLLKGGALLYVFDLFAARPTLDIDLLGIGVKNSLPNMKNIFSEICSINEESDGVTFDVESLEVMELMANKKYRGVRITVPVRLHSMKENLSIDIGFGDIVTPSPVQIEYPLLLDDKPAATLLAYSPETIVAEKFDAMISLSENNSRMKDFFDVYRFIQRGNLNSAILEEAITGTFVNRGTKYQEGHPLFTEEFANNSVRQTRWKAFLKRIKYSETLDFPSVMGEIREFLLPYWLQQRK